MVACKKWKQKMKALKYHIKTLKNHINNDKYKKRFEISIY